MLCCLVYWSSVSRVLLQLVHFILDEETQNVIAFDFPIELFSKCLRNGNFQSVIHSFKMKLAKREDGHPCIRVVIDSPGAINGPDRIISHELPVNVYNNSLILADDAIVACPHEPKCDVTILVSSLRILKNVIERIRNVGHVVTLTYNRSNGSFHCSMSNDLVSIKTQFEKVELKSDENITAGVSREVNREVSVPIDANKLLRVLSSHVLNPAKVHLGLKHDTYVVLSVQIDAIMMQYVLPCFSV